MIRIKLLDKQYMPTKAHESDAAFDCRSREALTIGPGCFSRVALGFCLEVYPGHKCEVLGRSGLAAKGILCHVGTVDSGYRGEVSAVLYNMGTVAFGITPGDRVAQICFVAVDAGPLVAVDYLDDSDRGEKGFGSTGGYNGSNG